MVHPRADMVGNYASDSATTLGRLAVLGAITLTASFFDKIPIDTEVAAQVYGAIISANIVNGAASLFYWQNPAERRARKVEKINHPPVFTIENSDAQSS